MVVSAIMVTTTTTSPAKLDKSLDALFEAYVRDIVQLSALLKGKEQRMRVKVRSTRERDAAAWTDRGRSERDSECE